MDIFDKAFHITKSYLKAQLIMSGLTCLILAIGFYLLDVSLWFLWAFLLAIADIIPIVGTGIFIIPWSIICFLKDDPQLGGYLLLVYGILVIIRQIVEPFVVGKGIGLSPLWTFLAMMAGGLIFGPLGFIFGPIAAAVLMAIYKDNNYLDK